MSNENQVDKLTEDAAWNEHLDFLHSFEIQKERAEAVFKKYITLFHEGIHQEDQREQLERDLNELIAKNLDALSIQDFMALAFDYAIRFNAQENALTGLSKSKKQAAKQQVRGCWELWRKEPDRYRSKSAFARDMLEKFPAQLDEKGRKIGLESARVIERWCKEWDSESS